MINGFSMTLTMKERFSCAWKGKGEKQLEGSVCQRGFGLESDTFETRSTFLASLNGIEAKGSHYSLPLEILQ